MLANGAQIAQLSENAGSGANVQQAENDGPLLNTKTNL